MFSSAQVTPVQLTAQSCITYLFVHLQTMCFTEQQAFALTAPDARGVPLVLRLEQVLVTRQTHVRARDKSHDRGDDGGAACLTPGLRTEGEWSTTASHSSRASCTSAA